MDKPATLVALYGITAASGGTLLPFTAPKKKAVKLGMFGRTGAFLYHGTRAVTARGVGDISERLITGEWSYNSGWDIAFGYTLSAVTGGVTGNLDYGKLRSFISIASQPIVNEFKSAIQGDGFNVSDLTFNVMTRSLTRNISNPLVQGSLRGGSRGVRKRSIQRS